MRIWDRVAVLLIGLFFVALMFGFIWQALDIKYLDGLPLNRLLSYLSAKPWRTLLTSLVLLLVAAYLFWLGWPRQRTEKMIVCDTPLGEVQIAERAIETLALRAARKVKGITDANASVRAAISGLDIVVQATVGPDLSLPQIELEARTRVADYIRETVGVAVNAVVVQVTRIAPEHRARVE